MFTTSIRGTTKTIVNDILLETVGNATVGFWNGYQTGDVKETLEEAALAGSEGFKMGAISGAIKSGGNALSTLGAGTTRGLSAKQVGHLQAGWNIFADIIDDLNSEQYEEILDWALSGEAEVSQTGAEYALFQIGEDEKDPLAMLTIEEYENSSWNKSDSIPSEKGNRDFWKSVANIMINKDF